MVDCGRVVLLATFVWACGGKSVSVQGDGDDDHAVGGSDGGRGGQAGAGTGATGGVSAGGAVSFGGSPGTGGVVIGGQTGTGGDACPIGINTTISGTVRDPAGGMPLYNVLVFIPSGQLEPMPDGIRCDPCVQINPLPSSTTLTDTIGRFILYVPPEARQGDSVSVVMQIGKWRREVTVGSVTPCVNNEITNPDVFRLPASQLEGQMPRIAVVTGADDSVECLLRRVGISDTEFTTENGGGAVHLYVGCDGGSGTGANHFSAPLGGASFPSASELFASQELLASYDLVLLGCEGASCGSEKDPYLANLQRYADGGGLLFLNHHQGYWLRNGSPEWRATAQFRDVPAVSAGADYATIDRNFYKGQALSEWLINIGASTSPGEILLNDAGFTVSEVGSAAQPWIYGPAGVHSMTVGTPVEAIDFEQCGRVTFNDFHVLSPEGERTQSTTPFPGGCINDRISPQEAAFAFQLFDTVPCIPDGPPP